MRARIMTAGIAKAATVKRKTNAVPYLPPSALPVRCTSDLKLFGLFIRKSVKADIFAGPRSCQETDQYATTPLALLWS